MSLFDAPAAAPGGDFLVSLRHEADFEGFREAVRRCLHNAVDPRDVIWRVGVDEASLFAAARPLAALPPAPAGAVRAPKAFVDLARHVVCHKAADRFTFLHGLLARCRSEPRLLEIASDADVARAERMAKNVRRCSHKMKAFVRFRSTHDADGTERFVAWFEPEHHTVDLTAPFFTRRFAHMRWSILTPLRSAHWDGETLTLAGGASRDVAPDGDVNEDLWRTYFAAIFNPARLKVKAMTTEMPKRYWKNMPESALIEPLIKSAVDRTDAMIGSAPRAPAKSTRIQRERASEANDVAAISNDISAIDNLEALAAAARHCERCPLHGPATQTVVGEGRPGARLMFVGEQPGDQEDLAGRPFVGPAGQLFERALKDAGIARDDAFVTNAVKHFKFEPRGKRRIHKSPNVKEIEVCRVWLDAERRLVAPRLTVALGASAARSLAGRPLTIGRVRGEPLTWADGSAGFATVHPSYLLRLRDEGDKRTEYAKFVTDLTRAYDLSQATN